MHNPCTVYATHPNTTKPVDNDTPQTRRSEPLFLYDKPPGRPAAPVFFYRVNGYAKWV
jgi:hypothetical protein